MCKYTYIYICVYVSISLSLSLFCSLCPPLALSGVDVSAHSLFLLLSFLFAYPSFLCVLFCQFFILSLF